MRKIYKNVLIYFLVFTLSVIPGVVFAAENKNTDKNIIEIYTAKDFEKFAKKCTLDSYSKDKKVLLKKDIELSKIDFKGVPIFLGNFDGNNHIISGLNIKGKQDLQGLFRKIGEKAVVSNLLVKGVIDGKGNYVGGIAGKNLGSINNCVFDGQIQGKANVGGIAGENIGFVTRSKTCGSVLGQSAVGGNVGNNSGTVIRCENLAKVNTKLIPSDNYLGNAEMNTEFIPSDNYLNKSGSSSDISKLTIDYIASDIVDIGGIIGINTGIVQSCKNTATIGYSHVGYNIGGVIGRQSGYVTKCKNEGNVFGRKEVGGIVGQVEPYVSYVYSPSKLNDLQKEINTLGELTTDFTKESQDMNKTVGSQVDDLVGSINDSKDNTQKVIDEVEEILDENSDSLNKLSVTMTEIADGLVPISEILVNSLDNIQKSIDSLSETSDNLSRLSEYLKDFGKAGEASVKYIKEANENLENAIDLSKTAIESTENAIDLAINLAPKDEITVALRKAADDINETNDSLKKACECSSKALEEFESLTSSEEVDKEVQELIKELETSVEYLDKMVEDLNTASNLTKDLFKKLTEKETVVIVTDSDGYQKSKDKLFDSFESISDNIKNLNDTVILRTNNLFEKFNKISNQYAVVANLMIDIIEDVMVASGTEVFKVDDVSYEDIENITSGKILNCDNSGNVDGDINIGGITGSISFEVSFDREDDYKITRKNNYNETRRGIAVVDKCDNTGDVISKKDGAGGVVGYMNFGFVVNSSSMAKIESIDGDYVGGIAGHSEAKISSCYSKNLVIGKAYIGGIVGYGNNVEKSYSLSEMIAESGFVGSIAGDLLEKGTAKENFFVNDSLGGIDGISYKGKAQPIVYKNLLKVENIPSMFKSMYIDFYVDGVKTQTIKVDYGKDVLEHNLPSIPYKEGHYGYWEKFNMNSIITNERVNAVYEPNITTLSSKQKLENIDIILVDGLFTNEEKLIITEREKLDENVLNSFEIKINNTKMPIKKVRYLMPEKYGSIQVLKNKKWVSVKAKKQGKYVVFNNPIKDSHKISFRAVKSKKKYYLIPLVILPIILLITFIIIKKRRNRIK